MERNLAASCSFSYADFAGFLSFVMERVLKNISALQSRGSGRLSSPDPCACQDPEIQSELCSGAAIGTPNGHQADTRACCKPHCQTARSAVRRVGCERCGDIAKGPELCRQQHHDICVQADGALLEHAISLRRLLNVGHALLEDMLAQEAAAAASELLKGPRCCIWTASVLARLQSALERCSATMQLLTLNVKA